jgi:hypothetical protein
VCEAEVNESKYKNKDINVETGSVKNGKQAEVREERWKDGESIGQGQGVTGSGLTDHMVPHSRRQCLHSPTMET